MLLRALLIVSDRDPILLQLKQRCGCDELP